MTSRPGLLRHFSLLVATSLLISSTVHGQNRFAQAPVYSLGGPVMSAITTDFNDDHRSDMLAYVAPTNASNWNVTLTLANSSGSYGTPKVVASFPANVQGYVGAGDFNGDGKIDFVIVLSVGKIEAYLGNGDGTFQSPQVLNFTGGSPTGLLVAKATNDSRADLVIPMVVNSTAGAVWVFPGNGNGTFGTPKKTSVADAQFKLASGDVNRDGLLDLAICGYDNYQLLLGKGDGTFTVKSAVNLGGFGDYSQGVITDYDADGIPDLILANGGNFLDYSGTGEIPSLLVLHGYGDGTFRTGVPSDAGNAGWSVTTGDLSGDGRQDLVVYNLLSSTVAVRVASSSTGLASAATAKYAVLDASRTFVVLLTGDVNGDGKRDVLLVAGPGVQVLLNAGGARLRAPSAADIQSYSYDVKATDLNHDGRSDVVIRGVDIGNKENNFSPSEHLYLALGNSTPTLTKKPSILNASDLGPLGIGYFNTDGNLDLLARPGVLFNNGSAQFTGPVSAPANIGIARWTLADYATAVGDLNGDGKADLVSVYGTELTVTLGNGDGTFKPEVNYSLGGTDGNAVLLRDLNKDGKLDAITVNHQTSTAGVFLGRGDGTFQAVTQYAVTTNPIILAVGDFNGDGKLDIAAASGQKITILLGNGTGGFTTGTTFSAGSGLDGITAVSLRGNTLSDLVASDGNARTVKVYYSLGNGTFSTPVIYQVGNTPLSLVNGDFNGDGAQDIAVAMSRTTAIPVLYNQGGTHITLKASSTTPTAGQTVTFTLTVTATMANGTPTGTFLFHEGSTVHATVQSSTGSATWSTSSLSKGTHTIYGVYGGNSTFNPHTSAPVTITVQ